MTSFLHHQILKNLNPMIIIQGVNSYWNQNSCLATILASFSAMILTPFGFSSITVAWRPLSRVTSTNFENGVSSSVGGNPQSTGRGCKKRMMSYYCKNDREENFMKLRTSSLMYRVCLCKESRSHDDVTGSVLPPATTQMCRSLLR